MGKPSGRELKFGGDYRLRLARCHTHPGFLSASDVDLIAMFGTFGAPPSGT
ncbi:MAG: hypothetical protein ACI8RZ_005106 [Myxococcota bacterium]|jgi:hypothetical protein